MTTIAASPLSDTLQTLVDARLDTIDRMLLGRVNRQDRLAIVREVESQIFDLLQGRDSETLDRDDVLAVLARLDPPEAYLPDESSGETDPVRTPAGPRVVRSSNQPDPRIALASGILGMVSVFLLLIPILVFFISEGGTLGLLLFFGSIILTGVMGLVAVVFAARARLRGGWAITGLVTGIFSMLVSLIGKLSILLEIA